MFLNAKLRFTRCFRNRRETLVADRIDCAVGIDAMREFRGIGHWSRQQYKSLPDL